MFKVGDRIVPKLDAWNKLRTSYTNCGLNLPKEPPIFRVLSFDKDGTCFCVNDLGDKLGDTFGSTFNLEDLLKAP